MTSANARLRTTDTPRSSSSEPTMPLVTTPRRHSDFGVYDRGALVQPSSFEREELRAEGAESHVLDSELICEDQAISYVQRRDLFQQGLVDIDCLLQKLERARRCHNGRRLLEKSVIDRLLEESSQRARDDELN